MIACITHQDVDRPARSVKRVCSSLDSGHIGDIKTGSTRLNTLGVQCIDGIFCCLCVKVIDQYPRTCVPQCIGDGQAHASC